MKNFLIMLMLLIAASVSAQQPEVVKDSSYLVKKGDIWFEVLSATYENGRITTDEYPTGDSSATVAMAESAFMQKSQAWAKDIVVTSSYGRGLREMRLRNNELKTKLGVDIQLKIETADTSNLKGQWRIRIDRTDSDLSWRWNQNQSTIQYRVGTGQWRQVESWGDIIVLNNLEIYPGITEDVVLAKSAESNRYVSQTRFVQAIPPGRNANRR